MIFKKDKLNKEAAEEQAMKLNLVSYSRMEEIESRQAMAESEEISDEALIKQAQSDDAAAEVLAIRYTERERGDLAKPYVLQALKANSCTAANFVEGFTEYGTLDFDRATIVYALAVSEQNYDDDSGKKLLKICGGKEERDIEYVLAADDGILARAMTDSVMQAVSVGARDKLLLKVEKAAKHAPVRDYKNSYVLSMEYFISGESAHEDYGVYIFNPRFKKDSEADVALNILHRLKSACENNFSSIFKTCVIDLFGKTYDIDFRGKTEAKLDQGFIGKKGGITDAEIGMKVSTDKMNVLKSGESERKSGAGLDDEGNIVLLVKETVDENALTVLNCTQCGSPMKVNGQDGETVVCRACGSSFLLNKKALGLVSGGIDFLQMEADKPKSKEIPESNFMLKSLFDGRLGVIMPDSFYLMGTEQKAVKYPRGNPPQIVYTNDSGTVNFAFSIQPDSVSDAEVAKYSAAVLASLKKIMPAAVFGDSGALKIGGKNVAFFEMITPAADTHIYNFMMQFILSGRVIMGSFNCLSGDRWFYAHIFKLAAKSLRFDD